MRKPFVCSKFERTGSGADDRKGNVGPKKTVVTLEIAAKVSEIVQQNPRKSIGRNASATNLKYTSTQKTLKNVQPTAVSIQNPK